MRDELPFDGQIWERDDELFIIEKVYEAKMQKKDGTFEPVTLVKHRCIDPMPNHTALDKFLEKYEPYDPEKE